jgi:voltage-gated potassium channel
VIERDPQLLAGLSPKIPHIQGDGADDRVLIDAGIHRARGVAVTCAPLADAVFVTLSARQLNPTVTILTRVENAEGGLKARRAGATGVVSPHQMGGWRMAHGLVRPHASNFLDLATLAEHDELLIEDVEVATRSRLDGRSLRGLALPREQRVLIMAVRRASGEMEVTPDGETEMRAGDVLIVVGRPNAVRAFAERARPIG